MQPKPIKPSIRKQKRAKRVQGRDDLKLLVESFTSTEERRHQISSALKISQDTWRSYALRNRHLFFLKVHIKMKTLRFAISVLKIREFNTLKACMKNWMKQKKCRADVTIFREAKRIINIYNLEYLKVHWDPSEHLQWFIDVFDFKKRPNKKFRLLYE